MSNLTTLHHNLFGLLGSNYAQWETYSENGLPTSKLLEQLILSEAGDLRTAKDYVTPDVLRNMNEDERPLWELVGKIARVHSDLARYLFANKARFYDLCEPPSVKGTLLHEYYLQTGLLIKGYEIDGLYKQECMGALSQQEGAFWMLLNDHNSSIVRLELSVQQVLLQEYPTVVGFIDEAGNPTLELLIFGATHKIIDFQELLIRRDINAFPEPDKDFWARWRDYPMSVKEYLNLRIASEGLLSAEILEDEKIVVELFDKIDASTSLALRKIRNQIVPMLMESSDPMVAYNEIKTVFERNNLPDFAKNFRIFEILYVTKDGQGECKLSAALKEKELTVSPVLAQSKELRGVDRRVDTLYRDILRISIESGDQSLKSYAQLIVEGQTLIDKVIDEGVVALSQQEQTQLEQVLNRLDRLYSNSLLGRMDAKDNAGGQEADLAERINQLQQDLRVREGQSFSGRIAEMFTLPLGYSSLEEVLTEMDQVKIKAHERNLEHNPAVDEGRLIIHGGDLLKGLSPQAFGYVLVGGMLSREFIGSEADSDGTPFDSDISYVNEEDVVNGVSSALESSLAKDYGDVVLLIRDRGQFVLTTPGQKVNTRYDKSHYELFKTGVLGERHYGIRTGLPCTEIDGVVVKDTLLAEDVEAKLQLEQIYFNIANNGFYVPVAKTDGTVIFTEADYQRFRINQTELQSKLSSEDYQPQELIDELKKSPYIQRLYEMEAGTGESTESHTTKVMQRFEDYIKADYGEKVFTTEEFRLMLALHDIGKPVAVKMTGSTEAQHEYTVQTLRFALQATGLSSRKIESMIAFVNQDALGEYLQTKISIKEATRELSELAEAMGVPRLDLLETVRQFLICDAGSYEGLQDSFKYSDDKKQVVLADQVQEKYNLLVEAIR